MGIERIVRTQLSLVVMVVDSYTRSSPKGSLPQVVLKENSTKPLRKDNAYYFTNLKSGVYTIQVECTNYIYEELKVDLKELSPLHPVVSIWLKPKPTYSADSMAFVVKSAVRNKSGKSLESVQVEAIVTSSEGLKARLAGEAKKGSNAISLIGGMNSLEEGETVAIRDGDTPQNELVTIVSKRVATNEFILQKPLRNSYAQGDKLYFCTQTITDHLGEYAIYISMYKAKEISVELRFTYGQRLFHKEVTLEQGKPLLLDAIIV